MSVQLEFAGHACFRLDADTVIVSSLVDSAHANVDFVRSQRQGIYVQDVATGKQAATINGDTAHPRDRTVQYPLVRTSFASVHERLHCRSRHVVAGTPGS